MAKAIKVVVTTEVIVPENAEIIRIKDDDGFEEDYIRVAGKLVKPIVTWMEYLSADRLKESEMNRVIESLGGEPGMGYISVSGDFEEDNLKSGNFSNHYLEETE